ncbi:GTP binding protein [Aureococcus anophagefferens]|nr:GTP binding protein [Aureococcus anophagefferens]
MSKEEESKSRDGEGKDEGKDGEEKDGAPFDDEAEIKLILLGDSAVGKTKMVERFLMDEYNPQQARGTARARARAAAPPPRLAPGRRCRWRRRRSSRRALTLFRKVVDIDDRKVSVDIWDTAGQERFNKMHPAYYHRAHACILCFDVTRKATYQHLSDWRGPRRAATRGVGRERRGRPQVTRKNFKFASSKGIPFYFVSAADGTNVVKVFRAAIEAALDWKKNGEDFMTEALRLVEGP